MYQLSDDADYDYLNQAVDSWLRRKKRKRNEAERYVLATMIYQSQLENALDGHDRDGLLYKLYEGVIPWATTTASNSITT